MAHVFVTRGPRFGRLWLVPLIVAVQLGNAFGQSEVAANESAPDAIEEIVVRERNLRGRALSPMEPDLVLTEDDIAAYGVSSIGELLAAIAAESGTNRSQRNEPPVVLLNGRRISGFREIGRYPVEAVSRVEVLSAEASLSYGFPANQRVINFILKDDVRILAMQAEVATPEAGGSTQLSMSAQRLFIDGDTRRALDFSWTDRPSILESERRVVGATDGERAGRTIVGDSRQWALGASLAGAVLFDAVGTLSVGFNRTDDTALLGAGVQRHQTFDQASAGLTVNGPLAATTWTVTAGHQYLSDQTKILQPTDSATGSDIGQTTTTTSVDALVNAQLIDLLASPLVATIDVGVTSENQRNQMSELMGEQATTFGRDTIRLGVNADAPFVAPLSLPGEIVLNANLSYRRLSDLGALDTHGVGLTWQLNDYLQWGVSLTDEQEAPTLSALSAPRIAIPNTRIFDATTNGFSFAEVIEGGNEALTEEQRQVVTWGIRYSPWGDNDLTLSMDYTESETTNQARQFNLLTGDFEQAFPDRVQRAVDGSVVFFDRRPVRTASAARRDVRTSLNWTHNIAAKRRRATGPRPTRRLRSGRQGRLRLSLIHNRTLQDDVVLSDSGPVLDFLNGAAADSLGGTPRDTFDLTMYRWNEGLGVFLAVSYRASTQVGRADDFLRFDDRVVANARFTYELNYSGWLVREWPLLEEARVIVAVDNLFADPIDVRDNDGLTPTTLQRDLLDPFGRTFSLEVRKRF